MLRISFLPGGMVSSDRLKDAPVQVKSPVQVVSPWSREAARAVKSLPPQPPFGEVAGR